MSSLVLDATKVRESRKKLKAKIRRLGLQKGRSERAAYYLRIIDSFSTLQTRNDGAIQEDELAEIEEAIQYFVNADDGQQLAKIRDCAIQLIFHYDHRCQWDKWLGLARKIGIPTPQNSPAGEASEPYARLCRGLATMYRMKNDWGNAITSATQGLAFARSPATASDLYSALADVHRLLGQSQQASQYARRGIRLARRCGNLNLEALAVERLGLIYVGCHRYDRAVACYQRALVLRERLGDPIGTAHGLSYLSYAHINAALARGTGETALAHQLNEESYGLYRQCGDRQGMARLDGDIAVLFNLRGEYDEAISKSERARFDNSSIRYSRAATLNFIRLAHSHRLTGRNADAELAIDYINRAIAGLESGAITPFDCSVSQYFREDLLWLARCVPEREAVCFGAITRFFSGSQG